MPFVRIAGHTFNDAGICIGARHDNSICEVRLRWLVDESRFKKPDGSGDIVNKNGYAHIGYMTQNEYDEVVKYDQEERARFDRESPRVAK